MDLQTFPQHYARHLAKLGYPAVIRGGRSIVARTIADDAERQRIIADVDAGIEADEKRAIKQSSDRREGVVFEYVRQLVNQATGGNITKEQARQVFDDITDSAANRLSTNCRTVSSCGSACVI